MGVSCTFLHGEGFALSTSLKCVCNEEGAENGHRAQAAQARRLAERALAQMANQVEPGSGRVGDTGQGRQRTPDHQVVEAAGVGAKKSKEGIEEHESGARGGDPLLEIGTRGRENRRLIPADVPVMHVREVCTFGGQAGIDGVLQVVLVVWEQHQRRALQRGCHP
jgi:hypothetical protein